MGAGKSVFDEEDGNRSPACGGGESTCDTGTGAASLSSIASEDIGGTEDEWCFVDSWQAQESGLRPGGAGPLDEGVFKSFGPFMAASQDYATLSGCRFRSDSFPDLLQLQKDDLPTSNLPAASKEEREAARLRALPAVKEYGKRLRAGEKALVEEVNTAFKMVMSESVRNAMVAAFRELNLWPPTPKPPSVNDDDCDYEDLSAPVPVIAQRVWNDEAKRRLDASGGGGGGAGHQFRRAITASYLVDFATGVGGTLPVNSDAHLEVLNELSKRIVAWQQDRAKGHVEKGPSAETLPDQSSKEVSSGGWPSAIWTVGSVVAVAAAGTVTLLKMGAPDLTSDDEGTKEEEKEVGLRSL